MIKDLGAKLKAKRKELGLSISALSQLCGVSPGMISQIERDLTIPSVYVFDKLVSAMDGNYMHFFDDLSQQSNVTIYRGGVHRVPLGAGNHFQLLNPASNRRFEMYHIIFRKDNPDIKNNLFAHEGAECGYILSGKLTACIQNNTYELSPGDSIYFNSSSEHYFYNQHNQDCVCIWVQVGLPVM